MNKHHVLWDLARFVVLLILCLGFVSCVGQSEPLPRAWIDTPRNGAELAIGEPVTILSHVYAEGGVKSVVLSVNGEAYSVDSPQESGSTFTTVSQAWNPSAAGEYTLQVTAYDIEGVASSQASIYVRVIEGAATLLPDLTVTDIQLLDGGIIHCNFKNIGGDVLPAGRDVTLAIYVGDSLETLVLRAESNVGAGDSFTAGSERVSQQAPLSPAPAWPQLVACRIDSNDNVAETDEDNNELVRNLGAPTTLPPTPTFTSTPIPPPQIPTATLPPDTPTPTQPPDTSPPNISNIVESDDPIAATPCLPDSVTISVKVSDPSGISKVELHYRVVMGSQQGQWRKLAMSSVGGGTYQMTLGSAELGASLSPYGGGTIQYLIKAWDTKNNVAQSSTATVAVQACVE